MCSSSSFSCWANSLSSSLTPVQPAVGGRMKNDDGRRKMRSNVTVVSLWLLVTDRSSKEFRILTNFTHYAEVKWPLLGLLRLVGHSQIEGRQAAAPSVSSTAPFCLTRWGGHAVASCRGLCIPPWVAEDISAHTHCCASPPNRCESGVSVRL